MNKTFAEIADSYLSAAKVGLHRADGRPMPMSSFYNERRAIERSIKPQLGDRPYAQIDFDELQAVVDWTCEAVSAKEGNVARTTIRNLSKFADAQGHGRAPGVEDLTAEVYIPTKKPLDDDDFRTHFAHILDQSRDGAIPTQISALALLTMICTLQPPSAVVEMRIDDVDLPAAVWRKRMVIDSDETWLAVPLSARAVGHISASIAVARSAEVESPFVFPALHRGFWGEKPIDEKTPSVMMRRTRREAGLSEIVPQQFIDTGELWLTEQWVHPDIVRAMLGRATGLPNQSHFRSAVQSWDERLGSLVAGTS